METTAFSKNTLHLAIDMQRLFAEETVWYTPSMADILPNVLKLCKARPQETLYARFIVPQNAGAATGRWKTYYERWSSVTRDAIDPAMLDLMVPLVGLADESNTIDKATYSIFGSPGFDERLKASGVDTLIFSGVETDVCVYASVLDAVDAGYRVILAIDALTSSDQAAHDAVMTHLVPRLSEQVETLSTQAILNLWRDEAV
ncbi:isochorismatase family protein [Shinella sp. AETb1-6]|uniref:cysteine hydrolase family protein n=1 Tax=Shinella sp. AETb1-6 TaxID=2692210 RepID=UPI001370E51D|nr:cysteine hydrolase [Shinella sp. AETb1-6]MXN52847.1 isochorismatase family protein [Shinella sp. AETb1-6]WLS10445.1 cysteine hydrolase [Shinella sumterensis]